MANNYGPEPGTFQGNYFKPQDIGFSEFGEGRDLKDAREEKGVAEGISTIGAEGLQSGIETFHPKNG